MSIFDTPPSICISQQGEDGSDPVVYGHYYVSYRIRSLVLIDGQVVRETAQLFKLYMASDVRPPLCPDDFHFPREYQLSDRKNLSSFFHLKRGLQMTIDAREPEPLVMTRLQPPTTIHIHSKLSRLRHGPSSGTLGTVLGRCTISLRSESSLERGRRREDGDGGGISFYIPH